MADMERKLTAEQTRIIANQIVDISITSGCPPCIVGALCCDEYIGYQTLPQGLANEIQDVSSPLP